MSNLHTVIASGADDGYFSNAALSIVAATNTVEFGKVPFVGYTLTGFFRFISMPIPASSTINSAQLNLYGTGITADPENYTLYGVASGNVRGIDDYSRLNDPVTTANKPFTNASTVNGPFSITGLSSIVQEIVNRGDWSSGNALCFYIKPDPADDNFATVYSIEGSGASLGLAPTLDIDYSGPVIPGSINSNCTLYISTDCRGGLLPSGDLGYSPSGHIVNSLGSSGIFWSYVNSSTESQITDNDFFNVVESGHINSPSTIVYTHSASGLAVYNILTNTTNYLNATNTNSTFRTNGEGWTYFYGTIPGDNTAKFRRIRESASNFSVNSVITSGLPTDSNTYKSLAVNRKNKKIYILTDTYSTIGYDSIYRMNYDGSNLINVPLPSLDFNTIDVDIDNNKIYGITKNGASFNYIYGFNGDTLISECVLVDFPSTGDADFANVDSNSGILYLTEGTTIKRVNPITGCSGTVTSVGAYYPFRIDPIGQKFYMASGTSLIRTNTNFGSPTILSSTTSSFITSLDIDHSVYKSTIDFSLTDLPTGFGTTSNFESATNAWVSIQGQENFDFTNIYAKILTSDKQNIIWESYPEGCGQFFLASGKQTLNVGYTGSIINSSYNSISDWNGAVLRLEMYSNTRAQSSGNFRVYSAQVNVICSGSLIGGNARNSGISLYTIAVNGINNNIPLYVPGQRNINQIPLYTIASSRSSGNIPLYLLATYINQTLPLFMMGPTPGSINDSIPLWINSLGSRSGQFGHTALYVKGNNSFPGSLQLYLLGDPVSSGRNNLPLYLGGSQPSLNDTIPLYLANTGRVSGIPLYTKGLGFAANSDPNGQPGIPYYNSISLFIQRVNETKVLPLFVYNTTNVSGIPLYMTSAFGFSSGIPLVMPNTKGGPSGLLKLFTSGF